MLWNYIKVSVRNILKYRSYSLINILGLSVSLASVIFIAIYVSNELSYDRSFPEARNIYRVGVRGNINAEKINQAVTSAPMAAAILNDVEGVVHVTRIARFGDWLVQYHDKKFNETNMLFADSGFFEIFPMTMVYGNARTALKEPYSVVLTEAAARRYFGNLNPLGKMLKVEADTAFYVVTGVVRIPDNIHIHFDLLASLNTIRQSFNNNWLTHNYYTYVLTDGQVDETTLSNRINDLIPKYLVPQVESLTRHPVSNFLDSGNTFYYFVQPLTSIHLYSHLQLEMFPNGDIRHVYIFVFIAVLLLVIACINFTNLATARSATRAREVALRKVMGSTPLQLVIQFLIESLLLSIIAILIALVFVEFFTPVFQKLIQIKLSLRETLNLPFLVVLVLITIITGLLSGSYPAIFLSSFNPVPTLKGIKHNRIQNLNLRNLLVVAQFAASIFLLTCTFAIYRQISYMANRDLGFDKSQVLVIKRSDGLRGNIGKFKAEIEKIPGVLAVANGTHVPGKIYWRTGFFPEQNAGTTFLINQAVVSPGYDKVLGLRMVKGRFFSDEEPDDSLNCILNEKAVESLGLTHPIGAGIYQPVSNLNLSRRKYTVIGVVHDFNFSSLHYAIEPMIMTCMTNNLEGVVIVKISPEKMVQALEAIKLAWAENTADYIFDYSWLDNDFNRLYVSDRVTGSIFFSFSVLSIFIACLGLFGLIAFTAMQRKKEIGIRKTFGASNAEILKLLVKDTLRLIVLSLIIAWPLAFWVISGWLGNFSYHVRINPADFVISSLIVLAVTILTIGIQAIRASRQNPVESLRYE